MFNIGRRFSEHERIRSVVLVRTPIGQRQFLWSPRIFSRVPDRGVAIRGPLGSGVGIRREKRVLYVNMTDDHRVAEWPLCCGPRVYVSSLVQRISHPSLVYPRALCSITSPLRRKQPAPRAVAVIGKDSERSGRRHRPTFSAKTRLPSPPSTGRLHTLLSRSG